MYFSASTVSTDELEAKKYEERGDIDQALAAYQRIHPVSSRILNIIGQLYAEKKGNYKKAMEYLTKSLKMQEEVKQNMALLYRHYSLCFTGRRRCI